MKIFEGLIETLNQYFDEFRKTKGDNLDQAYVSAAIEMQDVVYPFLLSVTSVWLACLNKWFIASGTLCWFSKSLQIALQKTGK